MTKSGVDEISDEEKVEENSLWEPHHSSEEFSRVLQRLFYRQKIDLLNHDFVVINCFLRRYCIHIIVAQPSKNRTILQWEFIFAALPQLPLRNLFRRKTNAENKCDLSHIISRNFDENSPLIWDKSRDAFSRSLPLPIECESSRYLSSFFSMIVDDVIYPPHCRGPPPLTPKSRYVSTLFPGNFTTMIYNDKVISD